MDKVIALVGRPNVGKSTLFNRIAGKRISIVSDVPGVTRDRVSVDATWEGKKFILVDTGGITLTKEEPLWDDIRKQTEHALRQADIVVLMTDVRDGVTPDDVDAADMIRRFNSELIVAVNKADSRRWREEAAEFHKLGVKELFPIAALHDIGVEALMNYVTRDLPAWEHSNKESDAINVSIVGKPNTGKSRLLNALIGDERAIVSDVAGTTRDSIDSEIEHDGKTFVLIDTAGIRRRGKIKPGLEQFSVLRTLSSIERADVCLLVLGADELLAAQDRHIAGHVTDAARACMVVVNKWDLAKQNELTNDSVRDTIARELEFLCDPEIVFTSAHTGKGVKDILESVTRAYSNYTITVSEYDLNKALANILGKQTPPVRSGKQPRILRCKQAASAPPVFVFESVHPELIHFSYRRYLENQLRAHFGFSGVPLVLRFIEK